MAQKKTKKISQIKGNKRPKLTTSPNETAVESADLQIWKQLQNMDSGLHPTPALKKAELMEMQIIKVTIQILHQEGFSKLTFETVSRLAGCTRPLVHHYFKTKEDLLRKCVSFVRIHYQKYVVDHMSEGTTAYEKLMLYVEYASKWVIEYPEYKSLWTMFYLFTVTTDWAAIQNQEFVDIGWTRIHTLLQALKLENPAFKNTGKDTARAVQIYITGTVISIGTEKRPLEEKYHLISMAKVEVAKMIQWSGPQ